MVEARPRLAERRRAVGRDEHVGAVVTADMRPVSAEGAATRSNRVEGEAQSRRAPGDVVVKESATQRQCSITMPFVVSKAADGARRFTAVASTSAPDRHGDTIDQSGWDLTAFKKNPVILYGHDYSALPIARASDVAVRGGKLMVTVEFAPPSVSTKGDAVWGMIENGLLNALSVGFRPISWEYTDSGVHYRKQELLEISVVSVPANGEALIEARLPTARAAESSGTRSVDPQPVARDVDGLRRQITLGHRAARMLERQVALTDSKRRTVPDRALRQAELARRRGDAVGEELHLKLAAASLPPSEAQAARQILRRAEVERLKSS